MSGEGSELFHVRDLRFRYRGSPVDALVGLSFSIPEGEHTAVLGPNGAGKSTLLRLLAGTLRPMEGAVLFRGRPVPEWGRRRIGRTIGVVAQAWPPDFPLTVREFVELGRNPHLSRWQAFRAADRRAVERALARADIAGLAGRRLSQLSGGELQRAKLACALAQEPSTLLLDEPTAHLDLGHELEIFELLRDLVTRTGLSVVSVTHNLGLASRFADHLLLLADGGLAASGLPRDVLRAGPLRRAFGWPVRVVDLGPLGLQVLPLPRGAADRRPPIPGAGGELSDADAV